MFIPELEVPNLELCKKLKELGFPQDDGGWYWVKQEMCGDNTPHNCMLGECRKPPIIEWTLSFEKERFHTAFCVKAPTCRELGEWLPYFIEEENNILRRKTSYYLCVQKLGKDFYKIYYKWEYNEYYNIIPSNCIEGETEANTRAKMLIWLIENGYIKFDKNKEVEERN
jgi:hypothetical protein